jgi:hypothetical protein
MNRDTAFPQHVEITIDVSFGRLAQLRQLFGVQIRRAVDQGDQSEQAVDARVFQKWPL